MASVANVNELGGYSFNPRGNLWFHDESKFGQKMLMKMGWNKGKGLGKNEDGIKENLKFKFKCTNSGLGYIDQSYDIMMKGEYDSILKSLTRKYSCNSIPKSDDVNQSNKQKSKTVKRKIRYPKLFHGKDVSKYSEKDMKSIFLFSSPPNETEDEEIKQNKSVTSCLADSKKQLPKLLDSYNSHISVSDYFALKTEEKKGKKIKKELSNEINQDYSNIKSIENEKTVDVSDKKIKEDLSNETENTVVLPGKKNKKRKKKLVKVDANLLNLEDEMKCENSSKEKRRKLSQDLPTEGSSGVDNLEVIISYQNSQYISSGNKRKKSHTLDISSTKDVMVSNDSETSLNVSPSPKKKKKKLHNAKTSEFEESIKLLFVNALKQMSEKNIDCPKSCSIVNDESSPQKHTKANKSVKLKKKIKTLNSCLKNKKKKFVLKNVSFDENVSYKIINTCLEAENEVIPCTDLEQSDSPTQETSNSHELQKDIEDESSVPNTSFSTENENNTSSTHVVQATCIDETDSDENELNISTSHAYDSWIVSQKVALKMKMYKSMLKNIKKHEILKTTNMLSIKGYGNCGLK